MLEEVVDP